MTVIWVYNAQEAVDAVKASLADGTTMALRGRDTKRGLGRPVAAGLTEVGTGRAARNRWPRR